LTSSLAHDQSRAACDVFRKLGRRTQNLVNWAQRLEVFVTGRGLPAPEGKPSLDPLLLVEQTQGSKAGYLRLGKGLTGKLGKRLTAPGAKPRRDGRRRVNFGAGEGLTPLGEQALETLEVEALGIEGELVIRTRA
jgi:hypothetical protein